MPRPSFGRRSPPKRCRFLEQPLPRPAAFDEGRAGCLLRAQAGNQPNTTIPNGTLLWCSLALAALTSACAGEETIALTTSTGGSSGTAIGGFGAGGCDGATEDQDGDGYSKEQGDCNDCDANSSPSSVEVPSSGADEDCDGEIDEDESQDHCDQDLLTVTPLPVGLRIVSPADALTLLPLTG